MVKNMRDNFNLFTVQNALGYSFKDAELIRTAFVHKSFEGTESNVKLAFLGERLVEFLISDYLFSHGSSVGEKQLKYSYNSYIEALKPENYIKKHSLAQFIRLSALNEAIRESKAVCREVFFAICAAIYKDGGLPSLKGFLLPMIKLLGEGEKYAPSSEGKVISTEEKTENKEKHIKNARVTPSKSGIGISRAETVNTEPAPQKSEKQKKESAISKLLKKKDKNEGTEKPAESVPEADEQPRKRFIRDALEPVRLSDELRNFKPKKSARQTENQVSSPKPENEPKPVKAEVKAKTEDEVNYKSLLQELVQKSIRSANVLLKYVSKPNGKDKWCADAVLMDKVIGSGNAESKKNAEKAAAESAYKAIISKKGEAYRWFTSQGGAATAVEAPSTDYVSKINQHFQKTQHLSSVPVAYEKRNSGKKGVFLIAVILEGKEIARGSAKNPKEAKQAAAKAACKVLGIK